MKNLKKTSLLLATALVILLAGSDMVKAQTEVSTSVDLYSTYVWRGVAYSGPSWQPGIEVSNGGFAIGAWGSQGYDGFQEMDLYAGYSFDFGLSLGITDYFYPSTSTGASGPFLDGDSHAFELNLGYGMDAFSFSANYIAGGSGSVGDDIYFEAGYSLDQADLFIGAGDGWHSSDTEFAVVNIGIGTSKEIVITDSFSLPVSGAVILNPDTEDLYILFGFSF
ncbi:MAG: TorF family putative porin [Balneolaceae bacterium]